MPEELSDQEQQRLGKLEQLRDIGIDPYPARVKRSHTTQEALRLLEQTEANGAHESDPVDVTGRLMAVRDMGKSTFAHIQDGAGRIQIYLRKDILGDEPYERFKRLFDIGDFIDCFEATIFFTVFNNCERFLFTNTIQALQLLYVGLI